MIRTYVRAQHVAAVRWDGTNLKELVELCEWVTENPKGTIRIPGLDKYRTADVGAWLVKDQGLTCELVSDPEFRANYKESGYPCTICGALSCDHLRAQRPPSGHIPGTVSMAESRRRIMEAEA